MKYIQVVLQGGSSTLALSNKPDILLKRDLEVLAISGQRLKALVNEGGHIVADNADTNFSRLPARTTFVAQTKFVSGTQSMFLILFRYILCPQQMFPSLHSPKNIMGNNVSATMCPRLSGPLHRIPKRAAVPDKMG